MATAAAPTVERARYTRMINVAPLSKAAELLCRWYVDAGHDHTSFHEPQNPGFLVCCIVIVVFIFSQFHFDSAALHFSSILGAVLQGGSRERLIDRNIEKMHCACALVLQRLSSSIASPAPNDAVTLVLGIVNNAFHTVKVSILCKGGVGAVFEFPKKCCRILMM
ncbi:hypothetical protein ASPWEDRAFT_447963 [Aspergillus wentii DTO 134E9]|uniref:Uncharacterized protein n=1 Tax=Aspergillus wentii DTO 134E9 TaxID=1073089 RepID=A0A1L9RQU8_ASPWE|nr:uncharacterized protein ASPWEDRAFT_447963 [Aspergillus wentii DTO 134E9]OJJ37304.1 hypothetical protein ASPWEDRAFT_447963 [Aspergillus wentii DTO 134E9]